MLENIGSIQYFIAVIMFIVLYIVGAIVTAPHMSRSVKYYNYSRMEDFRSRKLVEFTSENENTIVLFACILFPLAITFETSAFFGKKVYNILIDNKDENRLASWFV